MARRNLKDFLQDDTLDLSLNDLQDVPVKEIAQFPKATSLDLSNNKLTILPKSFAVSLKHLVKLDLARNDIRELPKNIGLLVNLKFLDLYKNKIETLPLSFGNLKALRWLDLKENPLEHPWQHIVGPCLNAQDCKNAAKSVVNVASIMSYEIEAEIQSQTRKQQEIEEQEQKELNRKREKLREKKKRKNAAKQLEAAANRELKNGSVAAAEPLTETEDDQPEQSIDQPKGFVSSLSVGKLFSFLQKVVILGLMFTGMVLVVLKYTNEPVYNRIIHSVMHKNTELFTSLVPGHVQNNVKNVSLKLFQNAKIVTYQFWSTLVDILKRSYIFVSTDPKAEIYMRNFIHVFLHLYAAFLNGISLVLNTLLQLFVS